MRLIEAAVVSGLLTLISANAVGNPRPKNGNDRPSCVSEVGEGEYLMSNPEGAEVDCLFLANEAGTLIRLRQGEMIVQRETGILMHGTARIYTAGIPFSIIGDQAHLIEPDDVVDVIVEGDETLILSKEGCTGVTACFESEKHKKSYFLEQGDLLVLYRNGVVYAWEDAEGNSRISDGCSQANSQSARGFLWFLLLAVLLRLRRRSLRA